MIPNIGSSGQLPARMPPATAWDGATASIPRDHSENGLIVFDTTTGLRGQAAGNVPDDDEGIQDLDDVEEWLP